MDEYTYLSPLVYTPQPNFTYNSFWEWELNVESHRSMVYYNISEFNEPEFEEYDPTPYGGGYDQALTYGKPLPPSDAICYPISTSKSTAPISPPLQVPSSIPEPTKPISPTLQIPSNESTRSPVGGGEEVEDSRSPPSRKKETEEDKPFNGGEEISSHGRYGNGYDYPPDSFYPAGWSDFNCGDGYGRQEPQASWFDYCGYGNGRQEPEPEPEPQAPEYGICESLFGYWPCLSKKQREQRKLNQQQQQICEGQSYGNQWSSTADFIFGSTYPYGERRDSEVNSGYESYYRQQHNYKQSDCNLPLVVQNASYYQASPSQYIDGEYSSWEDSNYQRKYYYE